MRSTTTVPPETRRRHEPLAVLGCWLTTPQVHRDARGFFVSTYVDNEHQANGQAPLFSVAQTSFSSSAEGVLRGIHYNRSKDGCEKYVYCSAGAVLDIVVDLREGSPTFGALDSVRLSGETGQAVSIPAGVGHAFVALEADSRMTYLLSRSYVPEDELAVAAVDPAVGLVEVLRQHQVPTHGALSERDQQAPSLDECRTRGLLPRFNPNHPSNRNFPVGSQP